MDTNGHFFFGVRGLHFSVRSAFTARFRSHEEHARVTAGVRSRAGARARPATSGRVAVANASQIPECGKPRSFANVQARDADARRRANAHAVRVCVKQAAH